jgi:chemotaxis protein MotA
MKAITAIGIGVAMMSIITATQFEGTPPMAFFNIPAYLVVLGGTLGATMASTTMDQIKKIPLLYKLSFSPPELDFRGRVTTLVEFAERARREGLLALEDEIDDLDDEFSKKGLQLVVDGTDPDLVREILDNEVDGMVLRHHQGAQVFEKAGGFAPTLGILGTVCSLVFVLQNLSSPDHLGPAISGAFIATLMGVGSANVLYLPVAYKLKALSGQEVELRNLTVEGILAIQAGDNPRVVEDKLLAFLSPEQRRAEDEAEPSARDAMPDLAEVA